MGFDLSARNTRLGDKGYLRAHVYQMILLRSPMLAAGGKETLVYRKFAANGIAHVVVATPVIAVSSYNDIRIEADDLVCVAEPDFFLAISQWY